MLNGNSSTGNIVTDNGKLRGESLSEPLTQTLMKLSHLGRHDPVVHSKTLLDNLGVFDEGLLDRSITILDKDSVLVNTATNTRVNSPLQYKWQQVGITSASDTERRFDGLKLVDLGVEGL